MPVLVPSFLPPPPALPSATSAISATQNPPTTSAPSLSASNSPAPASMSSQPQPSSQSTVLSTSETKAEEELNVPVVTLSQPALEPELVAALASSMLGHVLFLKGQIPLPAAQLARLPQPLNATKAKKRTDMLNALDTLNSHLRTTFQALAVALAQRGAGNGDGGDVQHKDRENSVVREVGVAGRGKENVGLEMGAKEGGAVIVDKGMAQEKAGEECADGEALEDAQLVFAVGPTPGAPKARVVFAIRGLALDAHMDKDEIEECVDRSDEESEDDDGDEDSDEEDGDEDGDEGDASEDDLDQPTSRAPSPPSSQPLIDTPPAPPPPKASFTPFTIPTDTVSPSARLPLSNKPLPMSTRPPLSTTNSAGSLSAFSSSAPPRLNRKPLAQISQRIGQPRNAMKHAESQIAMRAAERALGKTLAEDGRLAAGGEIAPTHTHILIRAPRRFSHPAWRPRAPLGSALDACVAEALSPAHTASKGKKKTKAEGVLIQCMGSSEAEDVSRVKKAQNEDDEMIWWLWDGKLRGFADW
ncbi:unnamed protein product [Peniophora sp. CBMAI 1063]|nr:unnamed protein product [Peniophora sp. CBMAI 1063]